MTTQSEQTTVEAGTLIELARRFGPSDEDHSFAGGDRLFDLEIWQGALAAAIQQVLPTEEDLLSKAKLARENRELLLELWADVARLPYYIVQRMIVFVHRKRAMWDLEDDLEAGLWHD